MEKTLVLIKPDAVLRSYVGKIIGRVEEKGLKIAALKLLQLGKAGAEDLYSPHRSRPFFPQLVEFITSSPIVAMVIEGPGAIQQMRKLMGATDCSQAEPGTIRGDFGQSVQNNLVHGSDSPESAKREIPIFFPDVEIVSYNRPFDSLLFPTPAKV